MDTTALFSANCRGYDVMNKSKSRLQSLDSNHLWIHKLQKFSYQTGLTPPPRSPFILNNYKNNIQFPYLPLHQIRVQYKARKRKELKKLKRERGKPTHCCHVALLFAYRLPYNTVLILDSALDTEFFFFLKPIR